MIRDVKVKTKMAQKWAVVRKLESSLSIQPVVPGSGVVDMSAPVESYNLILVLAYSVLDEVLKQLMAQGEFKYKRLAGLEWMMKKSLNNNLPWQNYNFVNLGRKARNKLAHEAELVPKGDCVTHTNAIEVELKAWGVI